jgi:hypothetical protein
MIDTLGADIITAVIHEAPIAGSMLWVGWVLDRRLARLEAMLTMVLGKERT